MSALKEIMAISETHFLKFWLETMCDKKEQWKQKHLSFSGRDLSNYHSYISFHISPSLSVLLDLSSVRNTAKTSALCRWAPLPRLPSTGSTNNGHLVERMV